MSAPHSGGCQCGAIRFEASSLRRASLCHCRMCQKATGSFGGAYVAVERLVWTRGTPAHFQSSAEVQRGFCRDCGTPLTFEIKAAVAVTLATFDRATEIVPSIQMGRDTRLPWVDGIAALPLHPETERTAREARLASIVSRQHPDHDTDVWPPQDCV